MTGKGEGVTGKAAGAERPPRERGHALQCASAADLWRAVTSGRSSACRQVGETKKRGIFFSSPFSSDPKWMCAEEPGEVRRAVRGVQGRGRPGMVALWVGETGRVTRAQLGARVLQ